MFEHPLLRVFHRRFGPAPFAPNPAPREDPFRVLVESIVSQQLSTKAAKTILGRLWGRVEPSPEALLALPLEALRGAGLSQAKARALRHLSEKALEGLLVGLEALDDEGVKARLLQVRGVGPWTAEMFLMFGLRRPDVWPVGDLGLSRAALRLFGEQGRDLRALGEAFRPYRSHLAWYLWRTLE